MSGAGAERGTLGVTISGVRDEGNEWAIDRRRGEEWAEVERFGSRQLAQDRLDEMAASEEAPLDELRLRQID